MSEHSNPKNKKVDNTKKRHIETIAIRKKKKEEYIQKRRREDTNEETLSTQKYVQPSLEEMATLYEAIKSSEGDNANLALKRIRLSISTGHPAINVAYINHVFTHSDIPVLIQHAAYNVNTVAKTNALWILSNIASTTEENTSTIVRAGFLDLCTQLLDSTDYNIVEMAIWGLANLAGDNVTTYALYMFSSGTAQKLVDLMQRLPVADTVCFDTGIWALSNLAKHSPMNMTIFDKAVTLAHSCFQRPKVEVVDDACAILHSYTSTDEGIDRLMAVPNLATHMLDIIRTRPDGNAARAVYDTLCAFVQHSANFGYELVKQNVFQIIHEESYKCKPSTIIHICNLIMCLTSFACYDIRRYLCASNLFPWIIMQASCKNVQIIMPAMSILAQCMAKCEVQHEVEMVDYFISNGIIRELCSGLQMDVVSIKIDALHGLFYLLANEKQTRNKVIGQINTYGGIQTLEALQTFKDETICEAASELLASIENEDNIDDDLDNTYN